MGAKLFIAAVAGPLLLADRLVVSLVLSLVFSKVPKTMPKNRIKPTWLLEKNFWAQSVGLSMLREYI